MDTTTCPTCRREMPDDAIRTDAQRRAFCPCCGDLLPTREGRTRVAYLLGVVAVCVAAGVMLVYAVHLTQR
jgi:uncharacterized paraquat-inducible protein A